MKNTIKKYLKFGILLFGISLFFVSCSDENLEIIEDPASIDLKNDALLQYLKQLGYTDDVIEDKGAYYVVDGDMVYYKNKDYIEHHEDEDHTKQRMTAIRVSITDIDVWINPNMNANWVNASNEAVNRWNNVNSGLTLNLVGNAGNADIRIWYDSQDPNRNPLPANWYGAAETPFINGFQRLPGENVWINDDIDFAGQCGIPETQNSRIANVQHELGHTLGILHTNTVEGDPVPNTPALDPGSLMNGNAGCFINNFSANDIVTIQFLYPLPFFITGADLACRFDNLTFAIGGPAPIPAVANWTSSASLTITSSNNTTATVNVPADNRAQGWIRANFVGGGSVTHDVWVGKPSSPASISGPSSVLTGALVRYRAGVAQGASSYVWWLPYPFDVQNPIDYFSQNWQMAPTSHRSLTAMTGYGQNSGYVQVMGNNACGRGGARKIYVTHSTSGGGGIP